MTSRGSELACGADFFVVDALYKLTFYLPTYLAYLSATCYPSRVRRLFNGVIRDVLCGHVSRRLLWSMLPRCEQNAEAPLNA